MTVCDQYDVSMLCNRSSSDTLSFFFKTELSHNLERVLLMEGWRWING